MTLIEFEEEIDRILVIKKFSYMTKWLLITTRGELGLKTVTVCIPPIGAIYSGDGITYEEAFKLCLIRIEKEL